MWFDDFNKKALANPVINDAHEYGVDIILATNLSPGDEYWRIIGVHHLVGTENNGNHHLFFEALDFEGGRVGKAFAGWTWEGRQLGERADPVILDKPLREPIGNIGLGTPQTVSAWMLGLNINATDKSDMIVGVHTRHADEPPGNTFGHHSFYVVFQQTVVLDEEPDPIPPTPEPPLEKSINHYVLLGDDITWDKYIIISRWLAEQRVTAGFNWQEAILAQKVTAIGQIEAAVLNELRLSGSEVVELSGECALADEINWLLKSEAASE